MARKSYDYPFLYRLFHHFDDQRHVAVLQYLDHTVLVEGNAATGVGFRAFHMNKDSTAIGIDALLIEIGGDAVVILRLVGVHLLTLTFMFGLGGVDNFVVVLTVLIASIGCGLHINVGHRRTWIGFDAEGTQRTQRANRCLAVTLARLAKTVLTYIYIGDKQHLTVNGQTSLTLTAMHVIHFEQMSKVISYKL